jgi:hypothetical protein
VVVARHAGNNLAAFGGAQALGERLIGFHTKTATVRWAHYARNEPKRNLLSKCRK